MPFVQAKRTVSMRSGLITENKGAFAYIKKFLKFIIIIF